MVTIRQPMLPSAALQYGASEAIMGVTQKAPEAHEIVEYARYIGMDPVADVDLLWIAEEALTAALPDDWEEHFDAEGNVFYYNKISHVSSWDHPLDSYYKALYQKLSRAMKDNKAADKVNEAATKIQALYRGHLARRLYQVLLVEELERRAAIAVQAAFRGLQGRRRAAARRREAALQYIEAQARTIERLWRGHLGRKIARAKRQEVQAEKEEAASLIIQCWYRRHLAVERAQFLRRLRWVTRLSARVAVVQAAVRRVLTTRTHLENLRKENEAKLRVIRQLEEKYTFAVRDKVLTIQMAYRRYRVDMRVSMRQRKKEHSAVKIQKVGRGMLARKEKTRRRRLNATTKIQCVVRGFLGRARVARIRAAIEKSRRETAARQIQRIFRGHLGRIRAKEQRRAVAVQKTRIEAVIQIQAFARMMHCKKIVKKLRRLREVERKRAAHASSIQAAFRGYMVRRGGLGPQYWRRRRAAMKIQSVYRGYRERRRWTNRRKEYELKHRKQVQVKNAVCIQRYARGYLAKRWVKAILATRYGTVKASAHDIQRYKESLAREQMEVALYLRDVAAEKIQSAWRGYLGRKKARNIRKKMKAHLVKQNSAATMIQRSYRGHVARELVRVMRVMKTVSKKNKPAKSSFSNKMTTEQKDSVKAASKKSSSARAKHIAKPEEQTNTTKRQLSEAEAAIRIQSFVRGVSARRLVAKKRAILKTKNEEAAAIIMQKVTRGHLTRLEMGVKQPRERVVLTQETPAIRGEFLVSVDDDRRASVERIPTLEEFSLKDVPKRNPRKSRTKKSKTLPNREKEKKKLPSPPAAPFTKGSLTSKATASMSPAPVVPRPPKRPSPRIAGGNSNGVRPAARRFREAWSENSKLSSAAMECVDETPVRLSEHNRVDIEEEIKAEILGDAGEGVQLVTVVEPKQRTAAKEAVRTEEEKNSNENAIDESQELAESDDELPEALQRKARAMNVTDAKRRHDKEEDVTEQHGSAVKVQSLYRGHKARKEVTSKKNKKKAASVADSSAVAIQKTFRGHQSRKRVLSLRSEREAEAAASEAMLLESYQQELKVLSEVFETADVIRSSSRAATPALSTETSQVAS